MSQAIARRKKVSTAPIPQPGSDLVPDGWCADVVVPWADEQFEQASIAQATAQLAGLEAAYATLGADTLELTKARRYLEVRWGELLGDGSEVKTGPGRNASHASETLTKDEWTSKDGNAPRWIPLDHRELKLRGERSS